MKITVEDKSKRFMYGNKSAELPVSGAAVYLVQNNNEFKLDEMLFSNENGIKTTLSGVFNGYGIEKTLEDMMSSFTEFYKNAGIYLRSYTQNDEDAGKLVDVILGEMQLKGVKDIPDYSFKCSSESRDKTIKVVVTTNIKDASKTYFKDNVGLNDENLEFKVEVYTKGKLHKKNRVGALYEAEKMNPEFENLVKPIKEVYLPFIVELAKVCSSSPTFRVVNK